MLLFVLGFKFLLLHITAKCYTFKLPLHFILKGMPDAVSLS